MGWPFVDLCKEEGECTYTGPNLPASGINTGDSLNESLQKIDAVLFGILFPGLTTTSTTIAPTTTTTTTVVPSILVSDAGGTCGSSLTTTMWHSGTLYPVQGDIMWTNDSGSVLDGQDVTWRFETSASTSGQATITDVGVIGAITPC